MIGLVACGSFVLSFPRFFEYELTITTKDNVTVGRVAENFNLTTYPVYLIGYRIVLSFILIYLIPMSSLVALNIRIVVALWRSTKLQSPSSNRMFNQSRQQRQQQTSRPVEVHRHCDCSQCRVVAAANVSAGSQHSQSNGGHLATGFRYVARCFTGWVLLVKGLGQLQHYQYCQKYISKVWKIPFTSWLCTLQYKYLSDSTVSTVANLWSCSEKCMRFVCIWMPSHLLFFEWLKFALQEVDKTC